MEFNNTIPSHEHIKDIFNDTYNEFYLKWRNISSEQEWPELLRDARNIGMLHNNHPLCQKIIIELVDIIEQNYMNKTKEEKYGLQQASI